MSEQNQLKTLLNKSTVAQLKEQCSQRNIPMTPAKKSDLVNRLVLYLKDHPEDDLCKVANPDEEEEEEQEEEEAIEKEEANGSGNVAVKEGVEDVGKKVEEKKEEEGETPVDSTEEPSVEGQIDPKGKKVEEKKEEEGETPLDSTEEPSVKGQTDTTVDETATEGKEGKDAKEDTNTEGEKNSSTKSAAAEGKKEALKDESSSDVKDKDKKAKGNEEKDKDESVDYSEFIVIDDSESSDGKDGKKDAKKGDKKEKDEKKEKGEKHKVKQAPFRWPEPPKSYDLLKYFALDQRRRTLVISSLTVEDLAREEIKKFLAGDVENMHYNLVSEGPGTSYGSLCVRYKTVEEANKKFEEFPEFKEEGISVKKLVEEKLASTMVVEEACPLLAELKAKHSKSKPVPVEKRTICAHFVPEDTSEESLKSLFPDVKSFLWARDENNKYKGMLFMLYEDDDKCLEDWTRVRKTQTIIADTRIWFHTVLVLNKYGRETDSPLLSDERRKQLALRRDQLRREMDSHSLSRETVRYLQEARRKIEDTLDTDREERQRLKAEEGKTKKAEEKTTEKQDKDEKESDEKGSKSKADAKGKDRTRRSGSRDRRSNPREKKTTKRPYYPSGSSRRNQNRSDRPNQQPRNMQQRAPGYNRRQDRGGSGYQQGIRGLPQRSNMPQANPGGMGMNQNQGFVQQGMGLAGGTQYNPQATANAVNLLVGLSSILGGTMRRQGGASVQGFGGNFQQGPGGNQNQQGQWVGGFSDEPTAKRSRFSDGRRQ